MSVEGWRDVEYLYGIGILLDVRRGEVERRLLPKESLDLGKLIPAQKGRVEEVCCVGIYQKELYPAEVDGEKFDEKEFVRINNALNDLKIRNDFGLIDFIHRDLIMIVYNSNIKDIVGILKDSVPDFLHRVNLYPFESVPNVYDKDIHSLRPLQKKLNEKQESVLRLEGKCTGSQIHKAFEAHREGLCKEMPRIYEEIRQEVKEFLERVRPYGLTRDEWVSVRDLLGADLLVALGKRVNPQDFLASI